MIESRNRLAHGMDICHFSAQMIPVPVVKIYKQKSETNPPDSESSAFPELLSCGEEAKSWLFESAAPLWASDGWRSDGMFAEQIDLGTGTHATFRRVRVQARQLYAFCALRRLGWNDSKELIEKSVGTLVTRGKRSDGFFVHSFSEDGAPLDLRADLYDHAFVLFCLAHAAEALERPQLLDEADSLMDLLADRWRHPHGGYCEGEIDGPPRRQNPHMHLLEASQALWRISGRSRWQAVANEIIELCSENFIEPESGAITEYFGDDWSRLHEVQGRFVEPGHCLEWAWMFEHAGGPESKAISDRLVRFARAHGVNRERDVMVNSVLTDGTIQDPGVRVWPQCERMKAALARYRRTRELSEAQEAVSAFRGLQRHLDVPVKGLWRERWRPNGGWIDQPTPASSFYHIVCALSELLQTDAQ
jgi:mannose/cellobiose epimerase-like protein (N-acyl-D-glucosamine 2-epimerase family)